MNGVGQLQCHRGAGGRGGPTARVVVLRAYTSDRWAQFAHSMRLMASISPRSVVKRSTRMSPHSESNDSVTCQHPTHRQLGYCREHSRHTTAAVLYRVLQL